MPRVLDLMKNAFILLSQRCVGWDFRTRIITFCSRISFRPKHLFFLIIIIHFFSAQIYSDCRFNHASALTCSLAPLSVDARPVPVLLLEEAQGPQGGRLPRVGAPRRVGGHPGKRAQLRRGRWRGAGPGKR